MGPSTSRLRRPYCRGSRGCQPSCTYSEECSHNRHPRQGQIVEFGWHVSSTASRSRCHLSLRSKIAPPSRNVPLIVAYCEVTRRKSSLSFVTAWPTCVPFICVLLLPAMLWCLSSQASNPLDDGVRMTAIALTFKKGLVIKISFITFHGSLATAGNWR